MGEGDAKILKQARKVAARWAGYVDAGRAEQASSPGPWLEMDLDLLAEACGNELNLKGTQRPRELQVVVLARELERLRAIEQRARNMAETSIDLGDRHIAAHHILTGEWHECSPEGDPAQLPSGTLWTCPVDGLQWVSVRRMTNRKMVGEWRQRGRLR